ncbi:organic cation transporter protein-like [Saccoglossus kowalevskii]
MELDDALIQLGDFGFYQILIFLLVTIPGNLFSAWQIMVIVFTGAVPDTYYCAIPEASSLNESIPIIDVDEDSDPVYDSCSMYVNSSVDNSTMECIDGWYYDWQLGETIVTEWDLVCDRAGLSQVSQSLFMAAAMIGAFSAGHLSDRFGRKTIFLINLWSMAVLGSLIATTQTFLGYLIMRFTTGLLVQGVANIQFVLATEMFPPSKRTYAGFLNTTCWALGITTLAPIAYALRHHSWRVLQVVISAPAILTFYYYWVVPESLRWRISKGQTHEAEKVLYTAARVNNVALPEHVLTAAAPSENDITADISTSKENQSNKTDVYQSEDLKEEKEDGDPIYGYLDLVRTQRMALYTTVTCFTWFVCALVYYGISYNTTNFKGNVYLLFFLTGCVEIVANLCCMPVLVRWGRRLPMFTFLIISGASCSIVIFIPLETGTSLVALRVVLVLLGKFGVTAAFSSMVVWTPELFPTLLRSMGFAMGAVFSSIGGIIAPLTTYVASNNVAIPMMIFGVCSLVAAGLVLLLPETKDKVMPRTVEEANLLYGTKGEVTISGDDAASNTTRGFCNKDIKTDDE